MEKQTMVVATGNAHKLREFAQIFTEYNVISQKQAGFDEDVEETGLTFAENALIKARAAAKALGLVALADDSGICVDALGGEPGVFSARYSGAHGDDKANRQKLLATCLVVRVSKWYEFLNKEVKHCGRLLKILRRIFLLWNMRPKKLTKHVIMHRRLIRRTMKKSMLLDLE